MRPKSAARNPGGTGSSGGRSAPFPGIEPPRLFDPPPEILVLEVLTAVPSSSKKIPAPRRTNGRNAQIGRKPLPVKGLFLPRRPRTEIDRKDESREHVRSSRVDRRFRPFVRICPNPGPAKIGDSKPPSFPRISLPRLGRRRFGRFVPDPLGKKFFRRGQHVHVLAVPAGRLP